MRCIESSIKRKKQAKQATDVTTRKPTIIQSTQKGTGKIENKKSVPSFGALAHVWVTVGECATSADTAIIISLQFAEVDIAGIGQKFIALACVRCALAFTQLFRPYPLVRFLRCSVTCTLWKWLKWGYFKSIKNSN